MSRKRTKERCMKKLSCFLVLTLVLSLAAVANPLMTSSVAATGENPILSVAGASAGPGETVTIPVSLTSDGQVSALQFDLNYDQDLLTYDGRSYGNLTDARNDDDDRIYTINVNDEVHDSGTLLEDTLRVGIYSVSSGSDALIEAGSGTLVELRFQVNAAAQPGQSCNLVLSNVQLTDSDNNLITTTLSGGRFTVPGGSTEPEVIVTPGNISTVAGCGTFGDEGDGGPALAAKFNYIYGITFDAGGNLYIADRNSHKVRKVNASGTISTVAGNGNTYGGGEWIDGVPATDAQVGAPYNVAVDSACNLYITNSMDHRIRKVDTTGIITTIAGTGTSLTGGGYSGDNGPAVEAQLKAPKGLVTDQAGNIYICDASNYRLRKIDTQGNITTIAGNGTNGVPAENVPATETNLAPTAVTLDDEGNIYVVARYNVYKIDQQGIIRNVAGSNTGGFAGDGGPATEAQLKNPLSVAVDDDGYLYIADYSNKRVRMVDSAGIITTIAGDGTQASTGDGGPAADAQLLNPTCVALGGDGNLYVGCQPEVRKIELTRTQSQLETPPVLSADGMGNTLGQDITLSFTDDETWRDKISSVKVDDDILESGEYTITAGTTIDPGTITIDRSVFTEAADYTIVVSADGYADATVSQTITTSEAGEGLYTVTPQEDADYTCTEIEGIDTLTVNSGVNALKYFTVNITPLQEHNGKETVVFVHYRNSVVKEINATRADFDVVSGAAAGFNVLEGDMVKAYIVDELTNALDSNPNILQ